MTGDPLLSTSTPGVIRARVLLPTLVVVGLAVGAGAFDDAGECRASDGPQFRCWLLDEREAP